MELDIQADIDVLNDLLQDVAGEEEQEGDEEAFFDTDGADVDQDGGGISHDREVDQLRNVFATQLMRLVLILVWT
ncbi:hypothetical protein PHYBOEH_005136 [Phytophthora boehmeriae]|uniref:Uncharacterized protein n=1 Tax=Phytophthora boehmeriae TaxID=109152 RepID=A0A8T1WM96_9STRA|nr:hypothetical protein PHYBOEH_005136 [Phytophthora boehmeriae]